MTEAERLVDELCEWLAKAGVERAADRRRIAQEFIVRCADLGYELCYENYRDLIGFHVTEPASHTLAGAGCD